MMSPMIHMRVPVPRTAQWQTTRSELRQKLPLLRLQLRVREDALFVELAELADLLRDVLHLRLRLRVLRLPQHVLGFRLPFPEPGEPDSTLGELHRLRAREGTPLVEAAVGDHEQEGRAEADRVGRVRAATVERAGDPAADERPGRAGGTGE